MRKKPVRANDITTSELPHTRKELFFDLVKNRKREIFSLSLLFFVFCLPLVVDVVIFDMFIIGAGNSIEDASVLSSTVFSLIFYMMIISIPCSIVMFVGLGGLAHVCKNIVWQEGVIIGPDFFKGVKKNIKNSIFLSIVWSISLFILVVGIFFLLRTRNESSIAWVHSVGIGLCIVQFLILSIICLYGLTLNTYYTLSFRALMKNGYIFFVARFFKNIIIFLPTVCLVVALMFFGEITQIISVCLIIVFSSLFMILWTLNSHAGFDKFINQENYPEYLNKGLYK